MTPLQDHPQYQITWFLSALLLIPYLLWGIYALRHTLLYKQEMRPRTEGITLVLLLLFFIFQHHLLKMWLYDSPLKYIAALMGLFASAVALYGPMAVSLSTHMLVDMMMPKGNYSVQVPQYSSGEAFERVGDYEGAVREYMTVARMFPKDPTAALRVGDNLAKAGDMDEAATWFERGLETLDSPEQSLSVTNRLFSMYSGQLAKPDKAREVLEKYLAKFPDAEYTESVRQRLNYLSEENPPPPFGRPYS